jgi:hypothetical protein
VLARSGCARSARRSSPQTSALLALLVCGLCQLALITPGAVARTSSAGAVKGPPVPSGFVGMNVDVPLLSSPMMLPAALGRMVASGVESLRITFNWSAAQPVANGPIDFTQTDQVVGQAAQRGLTVMPVVLYAPAWDATPHLVGALAAPASDAPYADYVRALVDRYGPRGSYWTQNSGVPRRPIRMWQIWNEPNFRYDWPFQPFAPTYVRLLHAAHAAIKQADPGAKVVLAGMPNTAWTYLAQIYAVRGARNDFDEVAVHPYTQQPRNVITFLQLVRDVMNHHGDSRKPLLATETGWNSSLGRAGDPYCCQTTERGQARKVKALLPLLGAHRRQLGLAGFYYYTWASQEFTGAPSFNFAGLFDLTPGGLVAKPVFSTFRRGALALERCRQKGAIAPRCVKPAPS